MRKWCGPFLSAAILFCVAVPSSAEPKAFDGEFSVQLGSFPPFGVVGNGNLEANIDASFNVLDFTVPAAVFKLAKKSTLATPIVVVPGVATLTAVAVNAENVKGTFGPDDGVMKANGNASLFFSGLPPAKIPLNKAIGATTNDSTSLFGIPVIIKAKKWTIGTATLQSIPLGGGGQKAVTAKGDFTVSGNNQIFTYVAPTQITVDQAQDSLIPSFGRLTIEIIDAPEAGNVLLLATGAAVLMFLGYRRSAA